jgi:hypothetical protein
MPSMRAFSPTRHDQWSACACTHRKPYIARSDRHKSQEPCGLCLRPANACTIYLMRRSGQSYYPWTVKYGGTEPCPNATNFSYSTAIVSSVSSPCSNVPLQCPYCPDGSPAIWRYNMRLHFRHRHQGVETAKHETLWKITPEEAEAMAQVWRDRHKQPRRRGKGKLKTPLKVSEAHSSRKLSRQVILELTLIVCLLHYKH